MYRSVRIGPPIILIILGAIMYFAISVDRVAGIDLRTVGVISMAGGALWLITELIANASNKNKSTGNTIRYQ